MPEGDTIHAVASRLSRALAGREIERAEAPSPRSPLHLRAGELRGRVLERAEARGKHLLAHFSGDLVVHSHLGINGRWWIAADGTAPRGSPWLLLASGSVVAAQTGGKLLALSTGARVRNDPALRSLGPDPLGSEFDPQAVARRLLEAGRGRQVGDALLDQRIVAGVGNAIRNEACFEARISPWRPVVELDRAEAALLIAECERIMRASVRDGRRPRAIYRAGRAGCPSCGGPVRARGQGDANRTAYWCPRCQS